MPSLLIIIKYKNRNTANLLRPLSTKNVNVRAEDLPYYGFYPLAKGTYIHYESDTSLSDKEEIPVSEEVLANFNERWFSGWDAPADERRVKMYRVAREIVATPQYQSQIVGNSLIVKW